MVERQRHPTWGPKKLKDVLEERLGHALPSASTLGEILVRRGLITRRKIRARHPPRPTTLRPVHAPNDVWCVDYKGQFRLGDKSYCYPLTVTDQYSRYILGCEGMAAIDVTIAGGNDGVFRDTVAQFPAFGQRPQYASTAWLADELSVFLRSETSLPSGPTGASHRTTAVMSECIAPPRDTTRPRGQPAAHRIS